ncbi:MAG: RidA family protein [Anaerolineae bacterium]|nr:RidA family protein [Anaerolineae bacterium]
MTERQKISSGAPWEAVYGYSRALRVGNLVYVAGTTASDEQGNVIGAGDVYAQTAYALQKIGWALNEAGARFEDVVRTRTFITDISRWEEVAKAHSEIFGTIRPVSTLVQVSGLIDPAQLVEIEVDAVISEE